MEQDILKQLFGDKILKILNHFMANDGKEFYLREISRITGVSAASTYRILKRLVKLQILELNEMKTAKLYVLASNKSVKFLKSILEVDVVQIFVSEASKIEGVEKILLLGSAGKTKANVLLLGTNISVSEVKDIIRDIREKHSYSINQMTLSLEQYEQMSSMGLYPGGKKVLFSVK